MRRLVSWTQSNHLPEEPPHCKSDNQTLVVREREWKKIAYLSLSSTRSSLCCEHILSWNPTISCLLSSKPSHSHFTLKSINNSPVILPFHIRWEWSASEVWVIEMRTTYAFSPIVLNFIVLCLLFFSLKKTQHNKTFSITVGAVCFTCHSLHHSNGHIKAP